MSPKRGDQVPQPTTGSEWTIVFGTTEAAKGWQELENQAPGNLRKAWDTMRNDPGPGEPSDRHHQVYGHMATAVFRGRTLARWQIEVTSGGRIWYLIDEERRTVLVVRASTGHPKETE
ncbi:type II toxin-antitoxin system RelE/ParE family toxin [Kibdelosporangium lantanae]|uniref:Type II toxin-antitoxin system RelE/ParE family toxin n=1 Tax=Kibdelosporangium lantanae TaxID=1497396 RepID=A0ABW3M7P7_9PSEU